MSRWTSPNEDAVIKSTPEEVYLGLSDRYERANAQIQRHKEIQHKAVSSIEQAGIGLQYIDIVAVFGILQKSLCLYDGFLSLLDGWNWQAAICLLRSQLDNLLVVSYLHGLKDPVPFCRDLLQGKEVPDMIDTKSAKGKGKLHYCRLRELAKEASPQLNPWIDDVYKMASGFTHLSNKAIGAAFEGADDSARSVEFSLRSPAFIEGWRNPTQEQVESWLDNMWYATNELLDCLEALAESRASWHGTYID